MNPSSFHVFLELRLASKSFLSSIHSYDLPLHPLRTWPVHLHSQEPSQKPLNTLANVKGKAPKNLVQSLPFLYYPPYL